MCIRDRYKAFPLKDKYQEIEFGMLNDNELVINFEFSNNGICNGCLLYTSRCV